MSGVENLEKIHLFSCSFNYVFSYGLSFAKIAFTKLKIYFNIIKGSRKKKKSSSTSGRATKAPPTPPRA